MKKGKTSKINGFRTSKVNYGTVDSKEFKSVYLNIQTWVEPKINSENWNRIVLNTSRNIKHSVYQHLDKELFDDKFIVDLDLRTSGLNPNKRSFLNLEITLFLNKENVDFKSIYLREKIKIIANTIYSDDLKNSKYFTLSKTKNKELVVL